MSRILEKASVSIVRGACLLALESRMLWHTISSDCEKYLPLCMFPFIVEDDEK